MATDDQGPPDSFDEACTQTQSPPVTRTECDDLSHRDLHELRKQRNYAKKDSTASFCARLQEMDEVESARGLSMKRSRTQQEAMDSREPVVLGRRLDKRCRRADAYLNIVAQWRDKGIKPFWNTPTNLWDGAIDVVSSAEAADVCNSTVVQELSPDEGSLYEKDVLAAKTRELDAWSQFKVYSPMR